MSRQSAVSFTWMLRELFNAIFHIIFSVWTWDTLLSWRQQRVEKIHAWYFQWVSCFKLRLWVFDIVKVCSCLITFLKLFRAHFNCTVFPLYFWTGVLGVLLALVKMWGKKAGNFFNLEEARFGLLVTSALGLSARVDFPRFTSGVTRADLYAASMAAEPFNSHTCRYIRASVGFEPWIVCATRYSMRLSHLSHSYAFRTKRLCFEEIISGKSYSLSFWMSCGR